MDTKPSTTVRDVFLYLLSIVALYLSSFAFGRLLFSIINIYFPDPLIYSGGEYGSLRFSIATMIVLFPFYFFVTRYLVRTRQQPDHQDVRIRKWLIYLTLSLAAIAIVSDLVTLLYWLLDGDLTVRFLLKVAAVLIIAGAVFYYYFWELNARVPAIRAFVVGTISVVILGIIFGFWFIGSPVQRRAERLDEQRVLDLQNLQNEIMYQWQLRRVLPAYLDDLRDSLRGFTPPTDPDTEKSYEYRVLGPLQFELCANFATANVETTTKARLPHGYGYEWSSWQWEHGIGRSCFTRTIDPALYPHPEKPAP